MRFVKASKPLAIGIAAATLATAATLVPIAWQHRRSVRPLPVAEMPSESEGFDREQSAAIFVGVRRFSNAEVPEVRYAADDAVDLAYLFAMDRRVRLVSPRRVALILSGDPQKEVSRDRLNLLKAAGAQVHRNADQAAIRVLLQEQAALAGRNGIFIVSVATHGFVEDGTPYVLGSSSLFSLSDTALPVQTIIDVAARSAARRSLLFIDACREWIPGGTRAGTADPRTAAPLIDRMKRIEGQVVFYAAAAGKYAYDDDAAQNGVFTKAVIDGLQCGAGRIRDAVTVETLQRYVNREVKEWLEAHRHPSSESAIQVSMDGDTWKMPLSVCGLEPPDTAPARVASDGSVIRTHTKDGTLLWPADLHAPVVKAEVADLNADGIPEVIAATRERITVFDAAGKQLWSADETLPLKTFLVGNRFREANRVIVALHADDQSTRSRIVLHSNDGTSAHCELPMKLQHIAMGRRSTRHASRIIAASAGRVVALNPRKVGDGPAWSGVVEPEGITGIEIVDHDHDARSEIAISTASGTTFYIDIHDGRELGRRGEGNARYKPQTRRNGV